MIAPVAPSTYTLRLTVTERVRGGTVLAVNAVAKPRTTRRTITVGKATRTLAASHRVSIALALNPAGRRLLRTRHELKVALRLTQARTTFGGRTVRLTAPQRRRGATGG